MQYYVSDVEYEMKKGLLSTLFQYLLGLQIHIS